MKIKYVSDYPKYKAKRQAELRSAQVLPMKGDGRLASLYNRASYKAKTANEFTRERLIVARYQEWLESRDRPMFVLLQGGR